MKSGAKGLWATQTADNIFLTAAPQGDVTAIVKMKGTMTTNAWDEAGLILYAGDSGTAGDDSFVFIGRKERGGGLTRIGVVWEKNVSSHAEEYADNIAGDTIWLKLTKSRLDNTGKLYLYRAGSAGRYTAGRLLLRQRTGDSRVCIF